MLRRISTKLFHHFLPYNRLAMATALQTQPIISQLSCPIRFKFINYGIQGRRNTKLTPQKKNEDIDEELEFLAESNADLNLENDTDYEFLANGAMHVTRSIRNEQNVLVLQPYIKWGPRKSVVKPEVKLLEAEDLIRSLDTWKIQESLKIGMENYDKKTFFGKGKLEELQKIIKKFQVNDCTRITCVFVSKSMLTHSQKQYLEELFQVPVMDRFSVVIQILRVHAISRESKLQVALAEIPYIWRQMGTEGPTTRAHLTDSQKLMLKNREKKIKSELENVRKHRKMIRKNRSQLNFPIVAVVGYTNAGKTSLIKALTNQEKIQPRNQLFATLEITAHRGVLPCNLEVIFMDTVGFMADLPTDLFECFIATLEDAMLADLIIHVQDVSHINAEEQRKHVEKTLQKLVENSETNNPQFLTNIINVGNKTDLVEDLNVIRDKLHAMYGSKENSANNLPTQAPVAPPIHFISSTKLHGINDLLIAVEQNILQSTKRIKMIIRVPQGGEELRWLYKNAAVTLCEADTKSSEYLLVHVVLTELILIKFKDTFLKVDK